MRRTTGVPAMPPTPSRTLSLSSIERRHRDDGEIAVPPRHLAERHAALAVEPESAPRRSARRARARWSACRAGNPCAASTRSPRLPRSTTSPSSSRQRQRNFRARVGVGDRAADRALVAGLEMADEGQGGGEQRQLLRSGRARPAACSASPRRRPRCCRRDRGCDRARRSARCRSASPDRPAADSSSPSATGRRPARAPRRRARRAAPTASSTVSGRT